MNLEIFAGAMLGHFVGDYLFQNQWMATGKSQKGWHGHLACTIHVLLYTLAVALFTSWNPLWLAAIAIPHWIIDRWSLAIYILRAKNGYWPKNTWNTSPLCAAGQARLSNAQPSVMDSMPITLPLIQSAANNSSELQTNVWRLAFAAPIYIFNDNTLHWVCIWLTVKYLF